MTARGHQACAMIRGTQSEARKTKALLVGRAFSLPAFCNHPVCSGTKAGKWHGHVEAHKKGFNERQGFDCEKQNLHRSSGRRADVSSSSAAGCATSAAVPCRTIRITWWQGSRPHRWRRFCQGPGASDTAFPSILYRLTGRMRGRARAQGAQAGAGYRGFAVDCDPGVTVEEDLYRRDTTMNSMALDCRWAA